MDMARVCRLVSGVVLAGGLVTACSLAPAQAQTPWSFAGGDIYDTHAVLTPAAGVNSPTQINPTTSPRLTLKWSYVTQGDISATPTVEPGGLYVPDWNGVLYKINPSTGALIWSHKVSDYTGLSDSRARNSPAIGPSVVVIGDMTPHPTRLVPGARVIAVNKTTGALVWSTLIDSAPYACITGSAVIYGNTVYIGMTGRDEVQAGTAPGFVPSTRGAVVALNLSTGAILWKRYTVPGGYTGGSVWGSSPVVWPAQNVLLVGTGNNFSIPAKVSACVKEAGTNVSGQLACLDPTDYVDSILALDLGTGMVRWSRRLQGADTSTLACQAGFASCPPPPGPDYDFGSMPNLAWVPNFVGVHDDRGGTSQNYLLGAGQKSGIYWGLNPVNGGVFWSTLIGHGNILWGSAINTDDRNQVFVSLDNPNHLANVLAGNNGIGIPWNAGAWGSISLLNGHWKWQHKAYGQDLQTPKFGSSAPGPNSFTNRVLFTGSTSGYFAALNVANGNLLWKFNSGGTVESAPAIFNETVYWGTGYGDVGGVAHHELYAFSVP